MATGVPADLAVSTLRKLTQAICNTRVDMVAASSHVLETLSDSVFAPVTIEDVKAIASNDKEPTRNALWALQPYAATPTEVLFNACKILRNLLQTSVLWWWV